MKSLLLTLLFISSPLFSQTMMWEIKDNNSKVYLLGSIHIADQTAYPLSPVIENAYKSSNSIAVEVNIDQADMNLMMQEMLLPGNQMLSDLLDEETYKRISNELTALGVAPMYRTRMKPWAAIFTIMQDRMAKSNYNFDLGIDKYFLRKAAADSIEIKELETMEFQISMFDKFDDTPGDYLDYSLESLDSTIIHLNQLYAAWKNSDTNTIRRMLDMGKNNYPEYEKISKQLLDDRNVNMVSKIELYLREEEPTFVIVGAGHLLGKNGILQLMKNKGYVVTQK